MENLAYLSTFSTKECLFVELLWFYIMHTIGAVFSKSVESFDDAVPHYPKTMGGKVWWREVAREGSFASSRIFFRDIIACWTGRIAG